MKICIDCDDAAVSLKKTIFEHLQAQDLDITDLGYAKTHENPFYPEIGFHLAREIQAGHYERGILICGTGLGMAMIANKVQGVYAGVCHDCFSAERLKKSNDANVLTLGERVVGPELAKMIVDAWLKSDFSGGGSAAKVAQIEALLSTMPEPIMEAGLNNRVLGTLGNVHPLMAVHNNYPCKGDDKWVSIAILTEAEWKGFCMALDDPPWTKEEDFADSSKRSLNRKKLDVRIAEWTVDKTPQEVMEILQKAGVAAAPCADTEDRYFDPHFQEREIIVNVEHPATGVDFVPKVVCNLSETPGEIRRPAPLLGEHNNYVFGELLGLTQDEIERLVEKKVIY